MARTEFYEQKDVLGYRGERVYCENCRENGDKVLWKVLYEVKTKPGGRIPKEENEKILLIIRQHLMNFPDHEVVILRMKA